MFFKGLTHSKHILHKAADPAGLKHEIPQKYSNVYTHNNKRNTI